MGGASATPTDEESVVDEEEEEEEEENPRVGEGRPREGEEWPDEEVVGRDTVYITNLVKIGRGRT